ncbi:hypothetical protein OPT61_g5445 [Boeremia exigua]|uniref:Uncharacterized protein n=1 Tax=Boeremia exigua TaxID=749465 RepID=A0ACC2IAC2_9PLEO|nr:hypothetical protein OPT61_g5445 [Boeremia exigua]
MPSIGPTMPPQPSKRSRDDDDSRSPSPDASEKRRRVAGPALPSSAASPARTAGPTLPPDAASRSSSPDSDVGPAPPPVSRPARVMGPAAPPAPLDERPPNPPSDDSDSSDDDFGPAPPPAGATYGTSAYDNASPAKSAFDTDPQFQEAPKKAQRDDWMTMPPTQDDLAARLDPTKQRARKFNTGKSAGGGGGMSSAWTETPEQKLKRLQDEAMGITPAAPNASSSSGGRSKEEERRARKMREKIDAARGSSLVEQHQSKKKIEEDDPSKRVFDYEKDMAVQGNLNHKQKREMLSKSKGFGDRFSSGSFL